MRRTAAAGCALLLPTMACCPFRPSKGCSAVAAEPPQLLPSPYELHCALLLPTLQVVVDSIHYDSLPAVGKEALAAQGVDGDVAFKSRLRRLELDLGSGALVRTLFLLLLLDFVPVSSHMGPSCGGWSWTWGTGRW